MTRQWIKVSDDGEYLIVSRSNFFYPDVSTAPRNEECVAVLREANGHLSDGDMALPFRGAHKDAEDLRKMLTHLFGSQDAYDD